MNQNTKRNSPMREHVLPMTLAALGLLLPGQAAAQNECGVQAPGTPTTLNCAPGDYVDGISYVADGDLSLVIDNDSVNLNLNTAGLSLSATGDDALGLDASAFVGGAITGSDGVLFDLASEDGDIEATINRVTGIATTQVMQAQTTSGDIRVQTLGTIAGAGTGLELRSDTGDIHFRNAGRLDVPGLATSASLQATTGGNIELELGGAVLDRVEVDSRSGSGTVLVDITGQFADAALDVQSGQGAVTINLHDGASLSRTRIITRTGGDATINLHRGSDPNYGSGNPLIDMSPAAGSTTVLNVDSRIDAKGNAFNTTSSSLVQIVGRGAGRIDVHNRAGILGALDFSTNSGGVHFYNYGRSADQPDTVGLSMIGNGARFGSGNDVLHNLAGGQIISGVPSFFAGRDGALPPEVVQSSIDFGAGEDRWINAGNLIVGVATVEESFPTWPQAFHMQVHGLEHFDNSGQIILGGILATDTHTAVVDDQQMCTSGPCMATHGHTDGEFSTVLSMPGVHFVGSGNSRLVLDAALGLGRAQTNCVDRADHAGRWRLPGADCLDLSGGSTDGVTEVLVYERFAGDAGAHNPEGIVIVDVSGGSSAQGHFVLAADSAGYNAAIDGLDKGMFYYPLIYDAERQQHKLVGLPSHRAYQMPLLVQSAQAIGRTFAGGWQDRQVERRGGEAADRTAVWGRITEASVSRDVRQSVGPRPFVNDFDLDTTAVQLGVDWLRGRADDSAWTLGAMFGYANATADFDTAGSRAEFDGVMLGAYAGYQQGAFYLDALLSGNWLQMDYDDAALSDASDPFAVLKSQVQSIGLETEAGWRFTHEALQIEPLLAVSWIRSEFDEMAVFSGNPSSRPGNTVFGSHAPSSLRAALGARAAMTQALGELHLSYRLTARVWNELQGETKVRIGSQGPDVTVRDDFDGTLTEVTLGVGLENASRSLSGSLQVNGGFADGYDSLGVTAGFRYQW